MVSPTRVETGHNKKHLNSGCNFNLDPKIHGLREYINGNNCLFVCLFIAVSWDIALEMSFGQPDRARLGSLYMGLRFGEKPGMEIE